MIVHVLVMALVAGDGAGARQLFEAGSQAYEQGRYSVAIDAFEAAHKLGPRAVTAFSAAQAHRLQYFVDGDPHHLERAIELYRAYLELDPEGNRRELAAQHLATLVPILERLRREGVAAPTARPASARTQVIISSRTEGATVRVDGGSPEAAPAAFEVTPGSHRVEVSAPEYLTLALETVAVEGLVVAQNVTLEPQPGTLSVRAPVGARVTIDGQLVGAAPLPRPVEVPAGHHTVAVTARGSRPFVREVDLGRGQHLDLAATLPRTTQRLVSYGLFAACGALAAGAAVTFGLAAEYQSKAEPYSARYLAATGMPPTAPSLTTGELTTYQGYVASHDDLLRAGIITGSVGLAAGALGVLLYAFDRPEAPASTTIAPMVGPHLAGLGISGQY